MRGNVISENQLPACCKKCAGLEWFEGDYEMNPSGFFCDLNDSGKIPEIKCKYCKRFKKRGE